MGNKLNEHLKDVELSAFLSRTFKTRYYELISKGLNTMTGEEVLQLSSKLTVEEQQLFEGGRLSVGTIDSWLRGEHSALRNISNSKIRKRAQEADGQGNDSKQQRTG